MSQEIEKPGTVKGTTPSWVTPDLQKVLTPDLHAAVKMAIVGKTTVLPSLLGTLEETRERDERAPPTQGRVLER